VADKPDPFEEPARRLQARDPEDVAAKAGALWEEGRLVIPFLSWEISLGLPSISFKVPPFLDTFTLKLLTLLYLDRADGRAISNQWVPYRELPDGLFYAKSFNETVEARVAGRFGKDPQEFRSAIAKLGAEAVEQGDTGALLRSFPRIPLLFTLWKEDEEFPPSCNILFDASAGHYLNAFELKMLCLEIVGKVMSVANGKLSL